MARKVRLKLPKKVVPVHAEHTFSSVPSKPGRPRTGRSVGQPAQPIYRPEFCEMVIEFGKRGWSEAEMAFNGFGVTRRAMRYWAEVNPEFGEALARAREASLSWWEATGRENLKRFGFNTALYNKIITCRYRNEYGDRVTLAGDGEQPLVTRIERVVIKPDAKPAN